MRFYELAYLIKPDSSGEEIEDFSQKIRDFVQLQGGITKNATRPSKRRLGTPIKKQGEALLGTVDFYLNPEKLGAMQKELTSDDRVLRFLLATKQEPKKAPLVAVKAVAKPTEKPSPLPEETGKVPTLQAVKATSPSKVDLKDINKKIEEILNE